MSSFTRTSERSSGRKPGKGRVRSARPAHKASTPRPDAEASATSGEAWQRSSQAPARKKPKQSATSYSLWLLSRKEYSAQQLTDKLVSRGYSAEEAQVALAYLQESNYQDDARFAHLKAASAARQHGNRRVRQKLAEQGIASELVTQELEQLEPEFERACAAAQRFVGKEPTQELRQKAFRYLTYRGFGFDVVQRVWKELVVRNAGRSEVAGDAESFED